MYIIISDNNKSKQCIVTNTIKIKDIEKDCIRVILTQKDFDTGQIIDLVLDPSEAVILVKNLTKTIMEIALHNICPK
ncbi:hypothetical protein KAW18_03955 [candidate division WOR-3 bacterium]|nr:hypothetical protein [candidate division WOR-3 bacterium]